MNRAGVELDYSDVTRGMHRLAGGLARASVTTGRTVAARTAADLRANVPKRSGRLAGTVHAISTATGAAVTYGGSLPYADYIEGREGMVADAQDAAPDHYERAMTVAATREVARL